MREDEGPVVICKSTLVPLFTHRSSVTRASDVIVAVRGPTTPLPAPSCPPSMDADSHPLPRLGPEGGGEGGEGKGEREGGGEKGERGGKRGWHPRGASPSPPLPNTPSKSRKKGALPSRSPMVVTSHLGKNEGRANQWDVVYTLHVACS